MEFLLNTRTMDVSIVHVSIMANLAMCIFDRFESGEAHEPFFNRPVTDMEMKLFITVQAQSPDTLCSIRPELYHLLLNILEKLDDERLDELFLTIMDMLEKRGPEGLYIGICGNFKKIRDIIILLKKLQYTCFPLKEKNCLRVIGFPISNQPSSNEN